LRAHHGHGAVRKEAVRRITPGILLGTLAGGIAAAWLPDFGLRLFFNLLRAGRTLGRATDDRLPVARLKAHLRRSALPA